MGQPVFGADDRRVGRSTIRSPGATHAEPFECGEMEATKKHEAICSLGGWVVLHSWHLPISLLFTISMGGVKPY